MSVEPTIHQTKVFYLRCTPKVLDGRHGCVHRPARVQYIIHQHYFFVSTIKSIRVEDAFNGFSLCL